jgi:hypothetical protein
MAKAKDDEAALRMEILQVTRDTAVTAIEVTRATADAAIKSAESSNNALGTIFQWGVALVAALAAGTTGLGIWQQSKDRSALRREIKGKLDQIETSAKRDLDEKIKALMSDVEASFKRDIDERVKTLTAEHHVELQTLLSDFSSVGDQISMMCTDMVQVRAELPLLQNSNERDKISLFAQLSARLERIKATARHLKHIRTLSWAHAHHALAHYHVRDFRSALSEQESSVQNNEANWPDRHYNLACFALRCSQVEADSSLMETAKKHLLIAIEADAQQAISALDDTDLSPLFDASPALRERCVTASKRTQAPGPARAEYP